MREFGVGQSLPRSEDGRLLQGQGRFVDDMSFPNQCYLSVVRSPHAAAVIKSIDISHAERAPGVLLVLTGGDAERDGIGQLHTIVQRHQRDGSPMERPAYRVLAVDTARFVGDPVVAVVALTQNQARDAAELVEVNYEPLPAVTSAALALEPGAPIVWPDQVPENLSFVFEQGDRAAADAAFGRAHHVTRLTFRMSRVSANPLEMRNAIGDYSGVDQRYTLIAGVQIPHKIRTEIAANTLGIDPLKLRIISPDVGGAFGMKGSPTQEHILVLWAARLLQRPVRWQATRSESFLSDFHARDNFTTLELALNEQGDFLGLRVRTVANLGAYLAFNTPHAPTNNLGGLSGVYTNQVVHAQVSGVFTHTQPTAPYRGAGRPEATYALERIIDLAAWEMGIDRIAIRRRNLIPANAMPFNTGFLFVYDSGEFENNMDTALKESDWAGFEQRRAHARTQGKLRGIALVNAIEIAGGPFRAPNEEGAEIRFDPGGGVTLLMGSHSEGQGHETSFRQLAVELLGIAPEKVRVTAGDTDQVLHGRGTFGSRSMMAGGYALMHAAEKIIERGKIIAGHLLECAEQDLSFDDGIYSLPGTDISISLEQIAISSYQPGKLPRDWEMGLSERAIMILPEASFPNGVHVCEVELDPDTGVTELVNYVVVDDVGTVINPLLVKGQVHGGVAQGVGQAMQEEIVYDAGNGQLLTGSFMDYSMPRAADLSPITVISNEVPSQTNPLGIKGAGEAGTVGAIPVFVNAVIHALEPYGISHLDMPVSAHRVWQAINDVRCARESNGT